MLYKQFYAELGKLLYAVADIDGVISPAEKNKLKEIVKNELQPAEKHVDEYGTNAAYFTEIEFEILEESIADAQTAFESFIAFLNEHQTSLEQKTIEVIKKVAKELANAYYKTNKKETFLIKKLNAAIDAITPRPSAKF